MKKITVLPILLLIVFSFSSEKSGKEKSYCNPVNLNYRFQVTNNISYREGADPSMIRYKDKYILFVSHSGGYWYSDDMLIWKYLPIKSMPVEDYAPDVITVNDTTYYAASSGEKKPLYYSTNPLEDNWKPLEKTLAFAIWDPNFFQDDDGKVYLYWGCSNTAPIYGVRLGAKMQPVTEPAVFIKHNQNIYGWENPGDSHELTRNGYNEGAWMTKYNKKYYLQYAAPGTEFKTYADGVYTSDSPLGPFKYETYSPFSYKPAGFAGGAGHSSTFQDNYGNYWHISTMSISVRHMFERRLGLFPAAFDKDGILRVFTAFGDYPTIMPDHKIDFEKESLFRGWMLLSYKKGAEASSSMEKFPVKNAVDEDIRSWWSANTGNSGEWMSVQLDDKSTVNAIQVNFADNDSKLKSDSKEIYYCYRILASNDGKSWNVIVDKSNNKQDACHDYIELEKPVRAKYIKVENVRVPDGKFSVYDLRIFGTREGKLPGMINDFKVERNGTDTRKAMIEWPKDNNATGYIVNYGTDINKLYSSVMVYDTNSLMLNGLNKDVTYFFSINSFNESGISKGTKILKK
jgi:xylan 1,4-beta-xylosidase